MTREEGAVANFEHYLYVLECGDGSLYTGYTTDVAARVATHRAGAGAKYTKSHEPVRLVAQARFYSKGRALSAEARFKRLSRAKKDELLAKAQLEPLENVLRRDLPGFGDDTAEEFVCRRLAQAAEPGFAAFQAHLMPTVDARTVVGVRTPELRRIARELARRDDVDGFLGALPHRLFEENQLHAFVIGTVQDYDEALARYEAFLPYVDNWATCDQLSVQTLGKRPEQTLETVRTWLGSGRTYTVRFGIGVLMRVYLGELFDPGQLELVANARPQGMSDSDTYYVNMMRAWYFAEALAKQEGDALPYLERSGADVSLDEWTQHKAIQKAIESRRISKEMKEHLRNCR